MDKQEKSAEVKPEGKKEMTANKRTPMSEYEKLIGQKYVRAKQGGKAMLQRAAELRAKFEENPEKNADYLALAVELEYWHDRMIEPEVGAVHSRT